MMENNTPETVSKNKKYYEKKSKIFGKEQVV